MSDFLDTYRDVLIQIATPVSTGTGFYLKDWDLVVTNHHVVQGNRSVVVEGRRIPRQLVPILYIDERYDLAFLRAPQSSAPLPAIALGIERAARERDRVIAIGHPFGLKFSVKDGIISNAREVMNGIPYLHIDAALNPGNSGGPLIDKEGYVLGVNTFIIRNGDNIGFSLPVMFLYESLDAFRAAGTDNACRCSACLNVVTEQTVERGLCSYCGQRVQLPATIEEYQPNGVPRLIENIIARSGHQVALSRSGPCQWEIVRGSAKIRLSYWEDGNAVTISALLCRLPRQNIAPLYEYLLRENYTLPWGALSVHEQNIFLSMTVIADTLQEESGSAALQILSEKADYYDDILIDEYGASRMEEE